MLRRLFSLLLLLGLTNPVLADGLLPPKEPEVLEIKMPDGTTQRGFIKNGAFVPIVEPVEPKEEQTAQPASPGPAQQSKIDMLLLPAGTPVQVAIDKEIDGDAVKVGETISAHTIYPVKHNGKVVIPAGTPVKGAVTHRKNNMIAGVSGAIELGNFKIITPDGGVIPLTGNYQRKGHNRVVGSLVGAYFIGLPIFIKGQDGKVESGAEATMYTVQEWDYSAQQTSQASKSN